MKKVIITESQRDILEKFFIFEDENGAPNDKKQKMQEFGQNLAKEFSAAMKKAKINTGINLLFGKTDNENQAIPESTASYTTLVVNVDELNHMLVLLIGGVAYTQGLGAGSLIVKSLVAIPFAKPIVMSASSCRLNCLSVEKYDATNPDNMKYGKNKLVPDFLAFELTGDLSITRLPSHDDENQPNDNGEETVDADYTDVTNGEPSSDNVGGANSDTTNGATNGATGEKVTDVGEEAKKPFTEEEINGANKKTDSFNSFATKNKEKMLFQWNKQIMDILKRAEFTPALFHMNNFFFFPKGYAVMDDILAKYGMYVDRVGKATDDEEGGKGKNGKVKFKVSKNITGTDNKSILIKQNEVKNAVNNPQGKFFEVVNKKSGDSIIFKYDVPELIPNKPIQAKAYYVPKGGDKLDKTNPLNGGGNITININ